MQINGMIQKTECGKVSSVFERIRKFKCFSVFINCVTGFGCTGSARENLISHRENKLIRAHNDSHRILDIFMELLSILNFSSSPLVTAYET